MKSTERPCHATDMYAILRRFPRMAGARPARSLASVIKQTFFNLEHPSASRQNPRFAARLQREPAPRSKNPQKKERPPRSDPQKRGPAPLGRPVRQSAWSTGHSSKPVLNHGAFSPTCRLPPQGRGVSPRSEAPSFSCWLENGFCAPRSAQLHASESAPLRQWMPGLEIARAPSVTADAAPPSPRSRG